nr:hypothetical protein [Maliibacterium massiliense]
MADFFEKMKSTLVRGANTVAEESSRLVERGKIKANILKLEEERKDKIMALGQTCYHMYKNEQEEMDSLRKLCEEIEALDAAIAKRRSEDEELKNS